ncbi:hypothetical protein RCL1_004274 [Eukaryota sp. TZLM3-RCL]
MYSQLLTSGTGLSRSPLLSPQQEAARIRFFDGISKARKALIKQKRDASWTSLYALSELKPLLHEFHYVMSSLPTDVAQNLLYELEERCRQQEEDLLKLQAVEDDFTEADFD